MVTLVAGAACSRERRAGNELDIGGWYGSVTSYDVGHIFTDGLVMVEVTEDAEGPLRLVSSEPVMAGDSILELVGVRVRLFGCGLSGDGWHSFDVLDGFPPSKPSAGGSTEMEGFKVPARTDTPFGERCGGYPNQLYINVLFGYEVVAEGKTWRQGTNLVYEYQGSEREIFVRNRLTICAPAGFQCEFVGPDDE